MVEEKKERNLISRDQDAAKHPTIHRKVPTKKNYVAQVLRLSHNNLEETGC